MRSLKPVTLVEEVCHHCSIGGRWVTHPWRALPHQAQSQRLGGMHLRSKQFYGLSVCSELGSKDICLPLLLLKRLFFLLKEVFKVFLDRFKN